MTFATRNATRDGNLRLLAEGGRVDQAPSERLLHAWHLREPFRQAHAEGGLTFQEIRAGFLVLHLHLFSELLLLAASLIASALISSSTSSPTAKAPVSSTWW